MSKYHFLGWYEQNTLDRVRINTREKEIIMSPEKKEKETISDSG